MAIPDKRLGPMDWGCPSIGPHNVHPAIGNTLSDIIRILTNPRRGRAVVYNRMVFVGGQTAADCGVDIREQTKQILARIEEVLRDAATDKSRLLTAQIWLKDITRDFAGMNEIWDAWIDPDAAPTRATAMRDGLA
jgi:enamine deaminase RidA (YjgF/YER057c/UK114 family)